MSDKEPVTRLSVTIRTATHDTVADLAIEQSRSTANMAAVLIEEALCNRAKKSTGVKRAKRKAR